MNKDTSNTTTEGDIRNWVRRLWEEFNSPKEIARITGKPVGQIYGLLKELEKPIVAKAR